MNPVTSNDDADLSLLSGYQSPVPADLTRDLLPQLRAALPPRPRARWALPLSIAAAFGLTALAWALVMKSNSQPPQPIQHPEPLIHRPLALPTPPTSSPDPTRIIGLASGTTANPDTTHLGDLGPVISLGLPSVESQVSTASLILRARITGWNDTLITYDVQRVVFGTYAAKTLQLDAFYNDAAVRKYHLDTARDLFTLENNRPPTNDELLTYALKSQGVEKGRDVLLLLRTRPIGYLASGTWWDNPNFPLDKTEAQIVQILHDGTSFDALATQGEGDFFQDKLRNADAIVRAKLVSVSATAATWQVEKTLQGKPIDTPLVINHDLFRLRAQAVVNHATLTEDSTQTPVQIDARIAAEMKALIVAELLPGHEAILFLAHPTPGNATTPVQPNTTPITTHADLQYRLYDTSKRMTLDELEKALAAPQSIEVRL